MRFGIMAMQLGLILPAGGDASPHVLRERIGQFDIARLVGRLADAGFRTIEINPELELFLPGSHDAAAMARLATLKAERGLAYTVHLPLWGLEPAMPDQAVRGAAVATLADAIRRTASLEPEAWVLHTTGPLAAEFARLALPPGAKELVLERFRSHARASLAEILALTGIPPRRLALENVEFPLELPLALAEEFGCSLCLDTGHVLAGYSGQHDFAEAVERMLPRLAEVHLHDGYFRLESGRPVAADHIALGRGTLPLGWLLNRLQVAGFAGPIIFELSVEEALSSLGAVRAVRPEVPGS